MHFTEATSRRIHEVLLVEGDRDLAQMLRRVLRGAGYHVRVAASGEDAVRATLQRPSDVVILDIELPGIDGITVARALRRHTAVPIVMLTACTELAFRVGALDAGADDFLAKPFLEEELLARVRAVHRRSLPRESRIVRVGDVLLDPAGRMARRGDRTLRLTPKQFEVLQYFMLRAREVISRARLLDEVWRYDPASSTNTVHAFVYNLRKEMELDGESRMLHTVRGGGYVLRPSTPTPASPAPQADLNRANTG